MKFSQPIALFLGSILSASGIGCSAITAVVSDSRPASRESRSDTDRIAAIGRVFENQGRYDRAEAMYRKALKSRPHDPEIRGKLQQLAARRQEQKFGPTGTANAIAMADVVSPPKNPMQQARGTVAATPNVMHPTAHQTVTPHSQPVYNPVPGQHPQQQLPPQSWQQHPPQESRPQQPQPPQQQEWNQRPQFHSSNSTGPIDPAINSAALKPGTAAGVLPVGMEQPATVANIGWHGHKKNLVSSDEILVALEQPDDYVELLLKGMSYGDNLETRALAATMLGDCNPDNVEIRNALTQQLGAQTDPEVLIAVCDSQIERDEADQQTLNCLICLCTGFSSETKIQSASQLKYFVGTEHESTCVTTLNELLHSEESAVRATAALAIGDFNLASDSTITRLREMADSDSSEAVRDAANSTLTLKTSDSMRVIPASKVTSG